MTFDIKKYGTLLALQLDAQEKFMAVAGDFKIIQLNHIEATQVGKRAKYNYNGKCKFNKEWHFATRGPTNVDGRMLWAPIKFFEDSQTKDAFDMTADELIAWVKTTCNEIIMCPKYDGCYINVWYDNGIQVATMSSPVATASVGRYMRNAGPSIDSVVKSLIPQNHVHEMAKAPGVQYIYELCTRYNQIVTVYDNDTNLFPLMRIDEKGIAHIVGVEYAYTDRKTAMELIEGGNYGKHPEGFVLYARYPEGDVPFLKCKREEYFGIRKEYIGSNAHCSTIEKRVVDAMNEFSEYDPEDHIELMCSSLFGALIKRMFEPIRTYRSIIESKHGKELNLYLRSLGYQDWFCNAYENVGTVERSIIRMLSKHLSSFQSLPSWNYKMTFLNPYYAKVLECSERKSSESVGVVVASEKIQHLISDVLVTYVCGGYEISKKTIYDAQHVVHISDNYYELMEEIFSSRASRFTPIFYGKDGTLTPLSRAIGSAVIQLPDDANINVTFADALVKHGPIRALPFVSDKELKVVVSKCGDGIIFVETPARMMYKGKTIDGLYVYDFNKTIEQNLRCADTFVKTTLHQSSSSFYGIPMRPKRERVKETVKSISRPAIVLEPPSDEFLPRLPEKVVVSTTQTLEYAGCVVDTFYIDGVRRYCTYHMGHGFTSITGLYMVASSQYTPCVTNVDLVTPVYL